MAFGRAMMQQRGGMMGQFAQMVQARQPPSQSGYMARMQQYMPQQQQGPSGKLGQQRVQAQPTMAPYLNQPAHAPAPAQAPIAGQSPPALPEGWMGGQAQAGGPGWYQQAMRPPQPPARNQPTNTRNQGGLRQMMRQHRLQRAQGRKQQPGKAPSRFDRVSGVRGGSRQRIKRRNRPGGPIKGGLLNRSPTKTSQRGAFEGVLR